MNRSRPAAWLLPTLLTLVPAEVVATAEPAPTAAVPATAVRALGQGLSYLRVGAFSGIPELSATIRSVPALVLDLRHAVVATGEAAEFARDLAARTARGPLFVLVSPAMPPVLAAAFGDLPSGSVILGVPGSRPPPQVVVDQTTEDDQRAYAALDAGRSFDTLLSGKIEKERFDEAALVQEFKHGGPAEAEAGTTTPTAPGAGPEATPLPADRVLQRAVHLHRALRAIRPRT